SVGDKTIGRAAALWIHAPLLRRGLDQHLPGEGADLAIPIELGPGGGRAAGDLHPNYRVRVDRRSRSVLDANLRPVALQLVSQQEGKGRPDALAHLGVRE